jgi:hypothetical protein
MGTEPNGWQPPKTDWNTADPVGNGDLNRIEGNINAIELGNRTVDDAQTPSSDTGYLRQLLDWIVNRLKAITGETNWYDAPADTIKAIVQTIADLTLQIETKSMVSPESVANGSSAQFDVSGFSFNPVAVLNIYIAYSQTSGVAQHVVQLGGGPDRTDGTTSCMAISEITMGTNKITLSVRNQTGATQYVNKVFVTAVG